MQDEILTLTLINGFINPLMYFLNPMLIYKLIKLKYERSKDKSKLTQAEANKLAEYPEYDLAYKYASLTKNVLFVLF